jgi:ATP-dependent helicase/DNAse subunit B
MTAAVHILQGPAGSGKTRQLLERFRCLNQSAFGTVLWLGPNYRTIEALRADLLHDQSACLAPLLFTFQDFVEEIIRVNDPTARPLSQVQRRLLAEVVVTELYERGELSHFQRVVETRGFADGVFALLAELKRHEIWPAHLARAAYQRGYRGRDVARTLRGQTISVKERQCARIYARYQSQLIRHNLYDVEGRYWYARDLLARGRRQPFERLRAVFVDGFTDFTRTQREILEGLCGWVEELWLALPDAQGDERSELFTRPRATRQGLQTLRPEVQERAAVGDPSLPTGLAHLERQLFRPPRQLQPAADADGIQLLEAPGEVGEARLVARHVKTLLLDGVSAADILLTARDVGPRADLIREVFAEYGIPVDIEGTEPLGRNAAVAMLLRAARLPEEDWPFAGVTALLRSGYFRPNWSELDGQADRPQQAEMLLRGLGEAGGQSAYLKAIDLWADRPPPDPDRERAETSRRQRLHELAKLCRPFLRRFFAAWKDVPARAVLTHHLTWLRRLASDLGLDRVAAEESRDAVALGRLWSELEQWRDLEQRLHGSARLLERGPFLRMLMVVAQEAGLARTSRGPGRVRVLSAPLARNLAVPYLFVLGMGERGFPRLNAPEPFFEESERQAFQEAGLAFPCVGDLLPEEMLLFYQLVTRARRRLVLSYPAVDDRGQALLPSPFLTALLDCFQPGAIPVERRRMLLDGYTSDAPLCQAEQRVQVAMNWASKGRELPDLPVGHLPADLSGQLERARRMAQHRFQDRQYGPYDGLLRHPDIVAELQDRFGPDKVFSPTALEDYIACPFRYLMGNVLRLEPLDEPQEEIEGTDRGKVFHTALSRLHTHLREAGLDQSSTAVDMLVQEHLAFAIKESSHHASPAAAMLWRLEGQRLLKRATRYPSDWQHFVDLFRPLGVVPQPAHFERAFGLDGAEDGPLVVAVNGVEVRIGGRIDRVDVAETAEGPVFWVIDYKTGRALYYSSSDLKSFQKLQLTLYALAVERVLLTDPPARPLGLAYWLVTDTGPKIVLPSYPRQASWLGDRGRWPEVRARLESLVAQVASHIRAGDFPLKPRSVNCTETCPYAQICRIAQSRSVEKAWNLELPVVP